MLPSEAMDAADLRRFARRDWDLIAQSKEDFWLAQKEALTPAESIAMAAELWRYARTIKPDWPNDEERAADLAAHVRLAELFLHAARNSPR